MWYSSGGAMHGIGPGIHIVMVARRTAKAENNLYATWYAPGGT